MNKKIVELASAGIRCLYAAPKQTDAQSRGYHEGKAYAYLYSLMLLDKGVELIRGGGYFLKLPPNLVQWKRQMRMSAGGDNPAFISTWVFGKELWEKTMESIEKEYGKQLRKDIGKCVRFT